MEKKHYHQVDFLRGCMLLVMTLDHLLWSAFRHIGYIGDFTYEFLGPISAAEGFIFLSGLTSGLVYGKKFSKGSSPEVQKPIFRRVKELYLVNVICIFITLLGIIFVAPPKNNPYLKDPLAALVMGALHISLPSFLDILPAYCYFLLLLIPILSNLARRNIGRVLVASVTLWLIGQTAPVAHLEAFINKAFQPVIPVNFGFFDVFSWQLLFVVGATLGFFLGEDKLPSIFRKISPPILLYSVGISTILFLNRHHFISLPIEGISASRTLGPARLVEVFCVGYIFFSAGKKYPHLFTFKPITFLGRHSLYVYAYHVLLCYSLTAFSGKISKLNLSYNIILLVACLVSLLIPAYIHEKVKNFSKQGDRNKWTLSTETTYRQP